MKVVTYNIRYGLGLDQTINLPRVTDAVRNADIIALQEVERFWRRSDMTDQPEQISSLLKEFYWTYFPAFDVDASNDQPNGNVSNRRRQFGVMLLSKWPVLSSRSLMLPQLPTFNVVGMSTGALECVIDSPCGPLRVYSVHLSAASVTERMLQIDALLTMHKMIERCGTVMTIGSTPADPAEAENTVKMDWSNGESSLPIPRHNLLLGDFNFTEDSGEYRRIVGEADPVYGHGVHSGSFVDSWKVAKQLSGNSLTWWPDPKGRPPAKPLRLDYCFINTEFAETVLRAWVDTDATGSDHRPYWVEFDC